MVSFETDHRSVVSLALGRPFAIQDDDITVEVCSRFFLVLNS